MREYGRDYWRAQVALRGETAPHGHRRVPVIYIAWTGNTHIRGLNAAIFRLYGGPGAATPTRSPSAPRTRS